MIFGFTHDMHLICMVHQFYTVVSFRQISDMIINTSPKLTLLMWRNNLVWYPQTVELTAINISPTRFLIIVIPTCRVSIASSLLFLFFFLTKHHMPQVGRMSSRPQEILASGRNPTRASNQQGVASA